MGGHGALTLFLKNPGMYKSVSAFAPIANPMNCPWGEKAFKGYLGEDRQTWKAHDATELIGKWRGGRFDCLIDVGTGDNFYKQKQLLPENLVEAAKESGNDEGLVVRYQPVSSLAFCLENRVVYAEATDELTMNRITTTHTTLSLLSLRITSTMRRSICLHSMFSPTVLKAILLKLMVTKVITCPSKNCSIQADIKQNMNICNNYLVQPFHYERMPVLCTSGYL